jgi:hypothetical protein
MVFYHSRPNIKSLSLRRRQFGVTALERTKIIKICERLKFLKQILFDVRYNASEYKENAEDLVLEEIHFYLRRHHDLTAPPPGLNGPLPRIVRRERRIESFSDEEIPQHFRFRTKDQLRQLILDHYAYTLYKRASYQWADNDQEDTR